MGINGISQEKGNAGQKMFDEESLKKNNTEENVRKKQNLGNRQGSSRKKGKVLREAPLMLKTKSFKRVVSFDKYS